MLALIDTDPGIDDALALLYAWGSPELRLAGLTTVAGNVEVAEATRNLFRLLALRRPEPMPVVAQGAAAPLGRALVTAKGYHGEDGPGGLDDWPPGGATPPPRHAAGRVRRALRGVHRDRLPRGRRARPRGHDPARPAGSGGGARPHAGHVGRRADHRR